MSAVEITLGDTTIAFQEAADAIRENGYEVTEDLLAALERQFNSVIKLAEYLDGLHS